MLSRRKMASSKDHSGLEMPAVGLGCSPYRGGGLRGTRVDLRGAIETALELGYRLLDTAEVYGTEAQIGEILRSRPSPRRDRLFIVSKVWQTNHAGRHVLAACEDSLRRLGIEDLDLYLVHSPEAWRHVRPLGDLGNASDEELSRYTSPSECPD